MTTQETGAKGWRDTLNLPRTEFPMRASLIQNEPQSMDRWKRTGLYRRIREQAAGRPRYVFHDGPPYANGSIHLGHLLNKCMKDFVVRSRGMMGFNCPYVPGWDCHGLPIEHQVMQELVKEKQVERLSALSDDQRKIEIRRACAAYASKYHALQSGQLERLLTLGDYEDPYLTMKPGYERVVLDTLAGMVEQGLVFRALKPVHWSPDNETALAEAELEYMDREDPSIYVDFEAVDADAVYDAFNLPRDSESDDDDDDEAEPAEGKRPHHRPSFMIWTTTPWTLPANLAIAVHPDFEYALVRMDGAISVIASALVERVTKAGGAEDVKVLATTTGKSLVGLRYRHPFVSKPPTASNGGAGSESKSGEIWRVVAADYVTLEDGTGLVHTAPGHGADDFATGKREGLPVYCPVRENGTYDQSVPEQWRGVHIWKANPQIVEALRASGHLFHDFQFTHSYPHDWRGKTPVIFRCTEQWFIGVDKEMKRGGTLRETCLHEISPDNPASVKFIPAWGRNRLRGMLESRPDWCISRQRAWGLPIPAFTLPDGSVFMTAASVRAVAEVVGEHGSDAWFAMSAEQLLARYDAKSDSVAPASLRDGTVKPSQLRKGPDILDVWFESGSSWNAVMRARSNGADFPVEVYLEGADQHRGWFQTSLLPAVAVMGRAPYKAILTHGFTVDKDGRKISKSDPRSKAYHVDTLLEKYGVDVLRWWVASLSYEGDIKTDLAFFDEAGEAYRKVRNTLRFLLSNLFDFGADAAAQAPAVAAGSPPGSLEHWVLCEFNALIAEVREGFESCDFAQATRALYNFCNDTLSATYLAATKDRLYCDRPDSPRRVRSQSVMFLIADGLCGLLAPVLPHTADEAWRSLHTSTDDNSSVHLQNFPSAVPLSIKTDWAKVFSARERAMNAVERFRTEHPGADGKPLAPLELGVEIAEEQLGGVSTEDFADLCGVSLVRPAKHDALAVIDLRDFPRCERSWKRDGTVRAREGGAMLSDRDAAAVGLA